MLNMWVVAAALLALVAVAFVFGKRHARRLQRSRRIHVDRFKLKRTHADIELEVFGSGEVVQAIQGYAKEHHVSTEEAMKQARAYLREIVPKFNLLAYYRFGAPIARAIMNFLYRVVVERRPLRDFNQRAIRGTTVVYVINHRSNADYVLVAHLLFKFISLSYAVGEWARVWPLNHLFKWFGAYFIRRRYREPLYHAILANFVRTITKHGVTQGIFIEGGLTRDGAFGKPKIGMLDYIVTAKRDPAYTAPLYIIPTAINYDRVLEDRNLTEELVGKDERSTKFEKLRTTGEYLFKNALRSVLRRFKRYGYAIVTFGTPISVDDFAAAHPGLLAATFEERKPDMQRLAETVMNEISAALPVTPVALVARIFSDRSDRSEVAEQEIIAAIEAYRADWSERVWLMRERSASEIWRAARDILQLRHLIDVVVGGWRWNPNELLLRDYYANSLATFEEVKRRGWKERSVATEGVASVMEMAR
ncbi:MAG: 1-acyl-sn-glycerol-3-phosphate acyltransferase [Thermoanaerobaculia bacterium]|nr:1-acyl-sn-glycerol-3-phosphate acyltransferase [Thermoanaerobaculia bacterium]